jgi:hypothetical protein
MNVELDTPPSINITNTAIITPAASTSTSSPPSTISSSDTETVSEVGQTNTTANLTYRDYCLEVLDHVNILSNVREDLEIFQDLPNSEQNNNDIVTINEHLLEIFSVVDRMRSRGGNASLFRTLNTQLSSHQRQRQRQRRRQRRQQQQQ